MSKSKITDRSQDWSKVRAQFPFFKNNPGAIFFDSASTTQKPESVLRAESRFYRRECSNAGRASYANSTRTSARIESARAAVARFINGNAEDIVFTSGATESLNTVALAWGLKNLEDGDEIMVCMQDHKSAVRPWLNLQELLARFGKTINIVPFGIHKEGDYELADIRNGLSPRTRLIALVHVHHVYGMDMEVETIRDIVGGDVLLSLDASQSIAHRQIDLNKLKVDFLSFSGHKMFAMNGSGVLWVSPRCRNMLTSIKPGGGYAEQNSLQALLESGTPNIPAVLSLESAIAFIEKLGMERIETRLHELTRTLYKEIKDIPGINFSPGYGLCGCPQGFGILSFCFDQASTSDLAFALDAENIMLRSGDHCQTKRLDEGGGNEPQYLRASLQIYNTEEEIKELAQVLRHLVG
ncbi:MAG: aminotransferase class V-fold PLP-dependent enzyme [Cyanobacteriota/Melainabacteria group bacterium]